MTDSPRRRIGLPWYSREDYPRIRAMMNDPHNLAPSYDQWFMAAQNNERVAQEAGLEVVRVPITPEDFAAWCSARGVEPGSSARSQRAQEEVASRP
ncbi:hypothetical protein ACFOYU_18700 [Microvirga sp. GCM10011540]|uniref:hypothetical protein n=1 Tax=Microvirga sp. GCM10011540 TaxID=3317338 RepID=UPI0036126155